MMMSRLLTNDFIPLINVIGSGKEDSTPDHFAHNAAHRPGIDFINIRKIVFRKKLVRFQTELNVFIMDIKYNFFFFTK